MTKVRDIMTSGVDAADESATVLEVAKKLASGGYGSMPVCDGDRVRGMITDRDIVVKVLAEGKDPATTRAIDLVGGEVVTVGIDDSVEQAAQTMAEHQVRRLPVMDGTKLVGILAQADLARAADDRTTGDTVQAISR